MSAHAPIAPSSLDTTVECNAYPQMSAPYGNAPKTQEQLEGDTGHWLAHIYADDPNAVVAVSTMGPHGIAVDLDMIQGAELWRDTVGWFGVTEMPVQIPRIHPTACWGTPDRWRWDPIARILRVWDYKYGHRFVDVYENYQLIAYAVGLLDMLPDTPSDQDVQVELTIVQPRAYHRDGPVRTWGPFRADLLRGYVNIANGAAHKALAPNPVAKVGPYCLDCEARHECAALQRSAGRIADYSMTMDRVNLPPAALGPELTIVREAIKRLEARETGLAAQTEAALRNGARIPGFGLEAAESRLKWREDNVTTIAMGDAMQVNLRKDPEPITPTQAKKLKKVDQAVIDALASRPPAALRLVAESTDTTRKIFGSI